MIEVLTMKRIVPLYFKNTPRIINHVIIQLIYVKQLTQKRKHYVLFPPLVVKEITLSLQV